MSEKPQTGPFIKAFAHRIERATKHIDFIGNNGSPRERNYEEEALWYVAVKLAEEYHGCNTIKDWAYFMLEGMEPLTDEGVREFFWPEDGEITGMPSHAAIVEFFHG